MAKGIMAKIASILRQAANLLNAGPQNLATYRGNMATSQPRLLPSNGNRVMVLPMAVVEAPESSLRRTGNGSVVLRVLRDQELLEARASQERAQEVSRELRDHVHEQNEYISSLLQVIATPIRERMQVPVRFEVCQFCYCARTSPNRRVCLCGEVGYCSKECHALDWTRNHKFICRWYLNGEGVYMTGSEEQV